MNLSTIQEVPSLSLILLTIHVSYTCIYGYRLVHITYVCTYMSSNFTFSGSTHSIPVSTDDKKSISKCINSID